MAQRGVDHPVVLGGFDGRLFLNSHLAEIIHPHELELGSLVNVGLNFMWFFLVRRRTVSGKLVRKEQMFDIFWSFGIGVNGCQWS